MPTGLSKRMLLMVVAGGVFASGCGSTNPPCAISLDEVDTARAAAKSANDQIAALEEERDALERQIAARKSERAELEARKAQLQKQIEAKKMGGMQ